MPTAEGFDSQLSEPIQIGGAQARAGVPWQIWVVVALLSWEGVSNFFAIADHPIALQWLLMKVLFITGLIKGWLWVFWLFLVIEMIHVVGFLTAAPVISFLNFLLMVLVISARAHFYRGILPRNSVA